MAPAVVCSRPVLEWAAIARNPAGTDNPPKQKGWGKCKTLALIAIAPAVYLLHPELLEQNRCPAGQRSRSKIHNSTTIYTT